jgi:putative zinc finger/helix-turn-helix YgiT family protein
MTECPLCESAEVRVECVTVRQAFGLPAVTLTNVARMQCQTCGEEFTEIPRHGELMRSIRERLCFVGRALRGSEFAFLRTGMNISQAELAEILGVTNVTISRWEQEISELGEQTDLLIKAFTLESLGIAVRLGEVVAARKASRRTFEIDVASVREVSRARTDSPISRIADA